MLLLAVLDYSVFHGVREGLGLLGLSVGALAGIVRLLILAPPRLSWADHQVQLLRMCDLR